jgi:N6-L-threonylcarbamoyladenine synthase
MNILGIETSCDETSAAVLDERMEIRSSVVLSQDEIHAPYGGVVPELASRQHIASIGYVVDESLRRAKLAVRDMDAYAVTQGPGLIGSLLVGLSFAKGLAFYFDKPLVPVDHLEAHIHSAFLENREIPFPNLALLVSGGHTSLFFLKEKFHYQLVGKTRDDAAGEALDKIAKYLDLGYPGGPVIDKIAEEGNPSAFDFALPKMSDRSLDFSFSGLKTAALRTIKKNRLTKSHPSFTDFLASFENAVIRALLNNVSRAARRFDPRALLLCGGVARNKKLRHEFTRFARKIHLSSYIPSPELCTDNAAMVASLAVEKINAGEELTLSLDLNAYPRT